MEKIHSGLFLITATKAISHQLNRSASLNYAYIYSSLFEINIWEVAGWLTSNNLYCFSFKYFFLHEFISLEIQCICHIWANICIVIVTKHQNKKSGRCFNPELSPFASLTLLIKNKKSILRPVQRCCSTNPCCHWATLSQGN